MAVTPREAADASMKIGHSATLRITGGVGLSEATADQLEKIVAEANAAGPHFTQGTKEGR